MSRAAAGQLTTPQSDIFLTEIRLPDDKKSIIATSQQPGDASVCMELPDDKKSIVTTSQQPGDASARTKLPDGKKSIIATSQPLSNASVRMNSRDNNGAIFLLMGLCLQNNITLDPSPLMRLISRIIGYRGMGSDMWREILTFTTGIPAHDQQEQIGHYALSLKRPLLFSSAVTMDPSTVVDATLRGDETIIRNILNADPRYLLKIGTAKNSVNSKFTGTPFQAAIATGDDAMCEMMKAHFERLLDGKVEMDRQLREMYEKSLLSYSDKQFAEITRLNKLKAAGSKTVDDKLRIARQRFETYLHALESNDVRLIFATHVKAQNDNAFDFEPYADAIANASQAELDDAINLTGASFKETDDARAKSFDQLTLVEKLNRFREELVRHMQSELIFNPYHIVSALAANEKKYFDFRDTSTDIDHKKSTVIFSQLVGFSQRFASEAYKQDIRQGVEFLARGKESRMRPTQFNEYDGDNFVQNSLVDVSSVDALVIDGLGYKFGVYEFCCAWTILPSSVFFRALCLKKTLGFQNLCAHTNSHEAAQACSVAAA